MSPPYMKLYWADYHQDTRHLTREEHGAYFLLLGEAWNRGGYLPDDDVFLGRLALATPKEWDRLKPIVMAFFRAAPKGRWRHKRIAEELAAYDEVSKKRKEAGKRGGTAKAGKTTEIPEANAVALAKQKPTKPEPEPEEEKRPPTAPRGAVVRDEDVEAVWHAGSQPSRDRSSKAELRAAMEAQVRKGRAVSDIVSGVRGYLGSDEQMRDDGKFQQGVHRVVKGSRWEGFIELEPPPLFRGTPAAVAQVDEIGSLELPGPRRQRSWMEDWREIPAAWREHERGPKPGEPGCRVSPEIQREFGVEPARPQSVGGRAA